MAQSSLFDEPERPQRRTDDRAHHPDNMWEGWDDLTEPPDDETSVSARERKEIDLAEFWTARPWLSKLHEFARARRVGPWAVLGSALARVVTATPPNVVLPATIGSVASLNLFIGLVGSPGVGKDAAQSVARIAINLPHDPGRAPFTEVPLGSGEGLSHLFMRPPPRGAGPDATAEQYNTKALVRIGEIDTLGALGSRNGSTLTTQLRHAAMGEELGFQYVDVTKRMIVPRHSYRLCMIAGIQPARSAVLLDDADGGTPQRWLWLPAGDPAAPGTAPETPVPDIWVPPDFMKATRVHEGEQVFYSIDLPDAAINAIISTRMANLREEAAGLDAHAMITRTKVAAAIGLYEGRTKLDDDDWRLSGVIMAVSDTQRSRCVKILGESAAKTNEAQAVAEAKRSLVIGDVVESDRRRKALRTIKNRLARVGEAGETAGKLKNSLVSSQRDMFETVIEHLLKGGEIRTDDDARTPRYWWVA